MYENNQRYVEDQIGIALRNLRINNYSIETERIPLYTETYRSIVSGKDIKLIATTEVIPLSVTTLDIKLEGKIVDEDFKEKFSFPQI